MRLNRPLFALFAATLIAIAFAAPAPARAETRTPKVPAGFRIEPAITNIHHPTRLVFGPDGRLYIAQQTGEVIAVTLKDGKEVGRDQVAMAKVNLLGLALKGDKLWTSDTGEIAVYTRQPDGRYANRQVIVKDIPHGRHENDGLAWGPDGKLYWGLGSTTDRGPEKHPWSASIMRMNPDGTGVEVYAKGFRNPYGISFDPQGRLWVNDNGADDPPSPDELNLVVQGGDYGFPTVFGMPPAGSNTVAPVALFGDHNSTNGLVYYSGKQFPENYRNGIFVAEWGSSFDETTGRALGFVRLTPQGGQVEQFATGFNRPLDVTMGPDGDLWVGDFVAGIIYRITYEGTAPSTGPAPAPAPPPAPAPEPAPAPAPALQDGLPRWVWPAGAAALTLATIGIIAVARRRR